MQDVDRAAATGNDHSGPGEALRMDASPSWPRAVRSYIVASLLLHLAWEIVQLPLYTIDWSQPVSQQVFAILHCTAGDVMIASLSLLLALAIVGTPDWPVDCDSRVWLATMVLGVAYTIFSEWFNVSIRGTWAYSEFMPTLPIVGTGLGPLLQWFVIPTSALWICKQRHPWA